MAKDMPGTSQDCESEIGAKPYTEHPPQKADDLRTDDDSQSIAEKAARQAKG